MGDNTLTTDKTDFEEEVLYKMVDGERIPCTLEETTQIKAEWARAAAESEQQQLINDLRSKDLSTEDRLISLTKAVHYLIRNESIPSNLIDEIETSCRIQDQVDFILNSNKF